MNKSIGSIKDFMKKHDYEYENMLEDLRCPLCGSYREQDGIIQNPDGTTTIYYKEHPKCYETMNSPLYKLMENEK